MHKKTAAKTFDHVKENTFAAAKLLQENEALILEALLTGDVSTPKELRQLASDLYELLEVIVSEAKQTKAGR